MVTAFSLPEGRTSFRKLHLWRLPSERRNIPSVIPRNRIHRGYPSLEEGSMVERILSETSPSSRKRIDSNGRTLFLKEASLPS